MRNQDAEALLDAAVDAFDSRVAKSQRQTAQSFEAVARRLADIESELVRRPRDEVAKPIRTALSRLEARLDAVAERPVPSARDEAGLKRLENKLDSLLQSASYPAMEGKAAKPAAKSNGKVAWQSSLQTAVDEIGRRQKLLNGETPERLPPPRRAPFERPPAAAPQTAELQHLQRDIATLGARLEEMRLQDVATDLTRMRTDLGTMSAGLAGLAPRDSVTAIESAIKNLTTRIENSREDGMREALLQPITELADDLRNSLGAIDAGPSIDGLEREIRTIADRLETLGSIPHDPGMLTRIQEQTQAIHGLLTAAVSHPISVEEIERKVAALAEQVDRQKAMGPMLVEDDHLSSRLQQTHADTLIKIEDRLDELSQKVERAVAGYSGANSKIDPESLETVVKTLADKFTAAQDPRAGQAAFEALQLQISTLANRLEQSDSNFSALTALQHSVGELFVHLDETRFAANEAAIAARGAARDAVREVMDHTSLAPPPEQPAITREIADLRAVQDEAGRRTHSTLNAVHETLEKIVDRLAMLEEEIGEAKETSAEERQRLSDQRAVFERYRDSEIAAVQMAAALRKGREPRRGADELQEGAARSEDFLLEPGTVFSKAQNSPASRRPEADGESSGSARNRADFIAAARRAAQAAQADQDIARPRIPMASPAAKPAETPAGLVAQARDFLINRKRQLTLSLAALFLAAGAYAVVRTMSHSALDVSANSQSPAVHAITDTRTERKAAARAQASEAAPVQPQMPRDVTPPQVSDTSAKPDLPSVRSDAGSSLPIIAAQMKAPQKTIAGSDPIVVGSITTPKETTASLPDASSPAIGLREQAEGGNASAQYELATRYAEGKLVPRDFKLAAEWYEKAAARGLAPAQYRLGSLYEKGMGVTRDLARAKELYEKAAKQGNSHAMHNLAVLIAEGGDGKPDYAAAAIWFRKAAEFGIRDSQYNLAILSARGLGIQQDLVQSYLWFSLAAAQGDDDAGKKREDVAAKLDAKALMQAKAAVDSFQPREADPSANTVQTPPGGWDAISPAQAMPKNPKAKISRL